jgi:glycerol-3-phosphate dehydrogenase
MLAREWAHTAEDVLWRRSKCGLHMTPAQRERVAQRLGLWTFDGLEAARHLYEKAGFRLAHQQRGTQWGIAVDEQRFELEL